MHGSVDQHRREISEIEEASQRSQVVQVPVPESCEDVPRRHENMCQRYRRMFIDTIRKQQASNRHGRENSIRVLTAERPDYFSIERTSFR